MSEAKKGASVNLEILPDSNPKRGIRFGDTNRPSPSNLRGAVGLFDLFLLILTLPCIVANVSLIAILYSSKMEIPTFGITL